MVMVCSRKEKSELILKGVKGSNNSKLKGKKSITLGLSKTHEFVAQIRILSLVLKSNKTMLN